MQAADAARLTPKQEAFVRAYLETSNAAEAYRRAYNVSPTSKPNTVEKRACELLKRPAVAARVRSLNDMAAEEAALSKAWVIERLMRHARVCLGEDTVRLKVRPKDVDAAVEIEMHRPDAAGANRALELLGKELGMFVERRESTNTNYNISDKPLSEEEWVERYGDDRSLH